MPMYVENVLPRANFEKIFEIKDIRHIRVSAERFKGANIVKQWYKCQRFRHASDICRFGLNSLRVQAYIESLHVRPSERLLLNLLIAQVSLPCTYRDCPQTPQFRKKTNPKQTDINSTTQIIPSMMSEIFSSYTTYYYVKKSNVNDNPIKKVSEPGPKTNIDSGKTQNSHNTPTNPVYAAPQHENNSNYTTNFQEIFKIFHVIKQLLKFNKFIQCFKK